jgi:hypothetical protein
LLGDGCLDRDSTRELSFHTPTLSRRNSNELRRNS